MLTFVLNIQWHTSVSKAQPDTMHRNSSITTCWQSGPARPRWHFKEYLWCIFLSAVSGYCCLLLCRLAYETSYNYCIPKLCWHLFHYQLEALGERRHSLAEADHYSNISQCNNVEPWWWKANPKGFGSLPAPRFGYATTIMVYFAHLLILKYPDHHQNVISSSLYYPGPLHKISSQSVHNLLSDVVHRQTDKPTLPKT